MNPEALRKLASQGLTAMKAGNQVVAGSVDEIHADVRHPELKAALEKGSALRKVWAQRIESALQEFGGDSGEARNPVLEGLYEKSRIIRRQAPDDASRDLGICADGQLALHCWIAAFGTIRAYASQLGMSRTVDDMQASLDEAKQADEGHNVIAAHIMRG